MDGLLATVEITARHHARELADLGRLVGEVHGEIRRGPVADDTEALELLALHGDETCRVFATELSNLGLRERRLLFLPEALLDLELDR